MSLRKVSRAEFERRLETLLSDGKPWIVYLNFRMVGRDTGVLVRFDGRGRVAGAQTWPVHTAHTPSSWYTAHRQPCHECSRRAPFVDDRGDLSTGLGRSGDVGALATEADALMRIDKNATTSADVRMSTSLRFLRRERSSLT